jgi:serine/threonine-protein kinase
MALHIDNTLEEKYEVIHEIKKGGFGIVYYGKDKKLNKHVAIKEIAPNLLDDPKYLDMFQEEALNIAKLSHNNIVHIYELKKVTNGNLYIIMEYIDGIDLEKIIRAAAKVDKSVPTQLSVYVVAEICMALDYAHQRRDAFTNKPLNLVHQDISPSNIMISRYGSVKLIDFGIATVRRHQQKKKDNKLRGKIPYIAPEQLLMGNHPDHRSDLFSLGLVLFESLTGERLFNSQEEVVAAGKNPKWFKKKLKSKKIPGALMKILMKSLEIDIAKRYQTANHMYIDLLQYLISCNETGELMDQLAQFVNDVFGEGGLPTPSTSIFSSTEHSRSSPRRPEKSSSSQKFLDDSWENSQKSDSAPFLRPEPSPIKIPPVNLNTQFQTVSTIELEAEDEEVKTVIDVIRISSRNHKKRVMQVCATLSIFLMLFMGLDTANGWTPVGVTLYDWLFPPAIEIITLPDSAQLFIDGKKVPGVTPIAINKIAPGVHKLHLTHEGYKPIIKSLFVPREGEIRIQGESGTQGSRSYQFKFSTDIEVNSRPAGALEHINGIRYNQRTPCNISWEIGTPFNIELEHEGFDRLTGYSLNTIDGFDEVEDRRFWQLNVLLNKYTKYAIEGTFRKKIFLETIPAGVEIYDEKSNTLIGVGGKGRSLLLTAGRHELILRKKNLIPKRVDLNVDENTRERHTVVLSRNLNITAGDELAVVADDIGATLTSLLYGRREYLSSPETTPLEITLPAYTFTAIFTKPGYQNKMVRIGPEAQTVQVQLAPAKVTFGIAVRDALTELPVQGARIYYNILDNAAFSESLLDQTDVNGQAIVQVTAGSYEIKVIKEGYGELVKAASTRPGETINLVFEIYPSN